jgi:hypothetical protein
MAFMAFADSQIVDELKTNFNADALEQVRLIKDKRTGASISMLVGVIYHRPIAPVCFCAVRRFKGRQSVR